MNISFLSKRRRTWDRLLCLSLICGVSAVGRAQPAAETTSDADIDTRFGHSSHGSEFDTGPRQKPWIMDGIARAPFPVSSSPPEVQQWFDQGNALMHSFWYYEAERAFRWCLKLDPDNAMAYWGMARAVSHGGGRKSDRAMTFLKEAIRRKDSVTERERLFIEALEFKWIDDPLYPVADTPEAQKAAREVRDDKRRKTLESLCLKYPEDTEARALLLLGMMGENRYGAELLVKEILSLDPLHPGAHHYRVHNWDYHEPEQALDSCVLYGRLAPYVGHALHMPGHVYASLGMWHEAAIAMDAATRVEKQYMQDSLTFPFDNWNYAHNKNFLCHLQEQLGLPSLSIAGARQLLDAPLDPEFNDDNFRATFSQGIRAIARAYVRYERWEEILQPETIPWRDTAHDQLFKTHAEALAHLALGHDEKIGDALEAHRKLEEKRKELGGFTRFFEVQKIELLALFSLHEGETLHGLTLLTEAAEKQYQLQADFADPPYYPTVIYNKLGEVYLELKSPLLAIEAFHKSLEVSPKDIFAMAGLVQAHALLDETEAARQRMGELLFVSQDAEADLPFLARAHATGITAEPQDDSPRQQRAFTSVVNDEYGPSEWQPFPAPDFTFRDALGETVTLQDYAGKNIMLVFYLGEECAHCVEQLIAISEKHRDWEKLDTVVLAASSSELFPNDLGIENAQEKLTVRFLQDDQFINARRFRSYDDFEAMELHSTTLIDKQGRVYWARFGGDPFMDLDFLQQQLERMNARVERAADLANQ
jgi:peroxiredoxin/tetratricopeptide (TPR) repeat protein